MPYTLRNISVVVNTGTEEHNAMEFNQFFFKTNAIKQTQLIVWATAVLSAELLVTLEYCNWTRGIWARGRTFRILQICRMYCLWRMWSIRFVVFPLYFSIVMHNLQPTHVSLMAVLFFFYEAEVFPYSSLSIFVWLNHNICRHVLNEPQQL